MANPYQFQQVTSQAPAQSATLITPAASASLNLSGNNPPRAFLANITASGNATVIMQDNSTMTVSFPQAGIYEFNWSVGGVSTTGLTATGTYYALY